jgi:hypothetical protein
MSEFSQLLDEEIIKKLWDRPVDPRFWRWVSTHKPHLIRKSEALAKALGSLNR